ncbi:hypothetical protein ACJMK2_041546 [Sinanodonta woodiana]|uniref:Proteasome-associated protein ECM29 homolog n=1 Tax=Sinanodonta woodiana TaxID=1069815 RepID=A0ABD3W5G8_SINWO
MNYINIRKCRLQTKRNFTIIYIKMGYARLEPEKQGQLASILIKCLEGRSQPHQDSFLQLLIPVFEYIKMPSSVEERRALFNLNEKPKVVKLIQDFIMDVLLLPYSNQPVQADKSSTAPSGGSTSTLQIPPGFSEQTFRRVTGDAPIDPDQLEKSKLGILKFLRADLFPEQDIVCHYVIATSDTRHSVATAADMELKRITGSIDWNSPAILSKLFSIFLGTVDLKGQTTKAELKKRAVDTRIRLKIFPYFLRARDASNTFPYNVQVIFDCLYGENTNAKLRSMSVELVHSLCHNCSDAKFTPISPVLLTKMVQVIGEAKEDSKLRSLAYVAAGKIIQRAPQLVGKDIALVQTFFDAMCEEDADTRLAVQESLSLMAGALRDLSETNLKLMEALIMQNIDKPEPQARMMAVQYALKVFPPDHIPSRYVLLLACGDKKDDIHIEASKALSVVPKEAATSATNLDLDTKQVFPDFSQMAKYLKDKTNQRVKSQHRYVIGNHTLPFSPVAFVEILVYLRQCLARSAGIQPNMQSLTTMKEQSPYLADYVNKLLDEEPGQDGPIQIYVDFIKQIVRAIGGAPAMYCLLEIVAITKDKLVTQFVQHLDWLKTLVFSVKDDMREHAANLYTIILCNQPDGDRIYEALVEFCVATADKSPETQHGALLALGFLIGQLLRGQEDRVKQGATMWHKIEKIINKGILAIAKLIKVSEETNPLLTLGACSAMGEIGRNAALPLPTGEENEEEITKLSVVNNLLAMVKSGKETPKSKERAALSIGQICVGEPKFPHRRKAIQGLLDSVQSKQLDLQFTIGESLVDAALGSNSPTGRNYWTETEQQFKARASAATDDDVEWYLTTVLQQYVSNVNPHIRQSSCVWLLALAKQCGSHQALQNRLKDVQGAFMKLLSEADEITQDMASKGLGLVYEICTPSQKDMLVSELVDTLMAGKRSKQEVTGDTTLFQEGALGKTPEGQNLSTYKELCSIATDLNQPDLVYKFMNLASHNAMWNSKKGAAFGFSTIAAQAGEQLTPYLPQIVPRLYRYQFDPNPKIQQAMSSIWNALVKDNKNTVDKYLKEILSDLLKNLTNTQWRIRESSCMAVNDLLRGRALDDVVEDLPALWETCLRVRDDIKESVRNAADLACKTLSRTSIKICDVAYGKVGEKATSLVLPCLLKHGLLSRVNEVRAIGLNTILKISKNAGPLLKPLIPVLVPTLLEAVSGLEPQVMNYLSLQVASNVEVQNKLDSARIAASKMSPMMETVNLCVQYVDDLLLSELIPRLTELIKSGIGVGTKASCSSFVVSLVHQCPRELAPHAGKLMGAFLHGLSDRNQSVRKSYALALGQLVKVAKDNSVEKLIVRLKSWYLEKEDEASHNGCGLALHAISQQNPDILHRHAALAMPLAFLAMHEQKSTEAVGVDGDSSGSLSLWEEVWLEITPGTEAGIRLYLGEIVELLQETVQSQFWTTKAQAAAAMNTVATKLGANLGPPHLGQLMSALLAGLQGRTWTGKESILKALKGVTTSCRETILKACNEGVEGQPTVEQVVEALLKECKKETIPYKLEALRSVGEILEVYSIDKFSEVFTILAKVLDKDEIMEVDGDNKEEEIKSELKQEQLECYYTVLGQVWPETQATQGRLSTTKLGQVLSEADYSR